jgi:hypothetical protein
MQLSADVMELIGNDPIASMLISLTCRGRVVQIDYGRGMNDLVAKYCDITTIEKLNVRSLFYRAVKFGRLDVLQLYHRRRPELLSGTIRRLCHPYYHTGYSDPEGPEASYDIAESGNLELLKWCRENGYEWDEWTYAQAVDSGNLELLQYCRDNGCPWNEIAFTWAAAEGHLEILQWLLDSGCPWDEDACTHAASHGQLEALKWLRANGCPWDKRVCEHAVAAERFDILQWARANGCPWDEGVCTEAANSDRLDILQWARANGCPWNIQDCLDEAQYRDLQHIIEWIESQQTRVSGCIYRCSSISTTAIK